MNGNFAVLFSRIKIARSWMKDGSKIVSLKNLYECVIDSLGYLPS